MTSRKQIYKNISHKASLTLTHADLDGFPPPQTEGAHFESLMRSIQEQGQTRPVIIDDQDVVWEGRTLLNVLIKLKRKVWVQTTCNGFQAALSGLGTR